jgi:hypothetical protein
VSRAKAPPLEQSLRTAVAVARAAGATRLKVERPDGSSYTIDLKPEADPAEVNDFDRSPNPPANRGSGT